MSNIANPAPRAEGDSPRGVTWQDLFDAADGERLRADAWARLATETAAASDQQSEAERDTSRRCAQSQRRRCDVFKTMAILIGRVAGDALIQERLRDIAQQEAAETAAREAEANETTEAAA